MEPGNEASQDDVSLNDILDDVIYSTSPMDDVIMMSLGLYSAGTDNHQYSGSRRVNMKIWGGVPSCNRNLFRHQLSCLLVLWLLSYASSRRRKRRRKHGQNGKNIFWYNIHIWCFFTEIFCIQFSFHIVSAIKLLNVEMT